MSALSTVLPVRRVTTAAAAVTVAVGLLAAGTPQAHAAAPAAATLTSRVAAVGDGLEVRSRVGAMTENTYVESTLRGKVTVACFRDGAVVPATKRSIGWITTGDLRGAPWYNNGQYIDAVAESRPAASSVVAGVVLKTILRDRAGELTAQRCAAGTTAGFHHYWITSVASTRYTFAGVPTGSFTSDQHFTYAFPAPLA